MAEVALAKHIDTIYTSSDKVASHCLQCPHKVQKAEGIVRLEDQVKGLKATLSEVSQALKGQKSARISASWSAIEAIGKCSTRFEYLKTKLASAPDSTSSTQFEVQRPLSEEDLDETIKELSTCNQVLSLALQTEQTSYHQLNDKNLINRLNSASSFQYSPLREKREIRLIQFSNDTSDSKSKSDRITITLDNVPPGSEPGSEPNYQALSYTWGDTNDPRRIRRIIVNGEDFFVTANLYAALQDLRLQFNRKDVLLWVDAVCINQLDNLERNKQVSMMREIYKQAKLVLIWLGPAFPNSDRAMEAFRKLGIRGAELTTPRMTDEKIIVSDDDLASLPYSPTVKLTEGEWWNRVWVLQELAVAKEAEFVCGENRVSLKHFVAAIQFLKSYLHVKTNRLEVGSQYEQTKEMENLAYVVNRKLSRIYFFFYLRAQFVEGKVWLEDLLARTCGFLRSEQTMKATDPRDRVYAIRGLLSEREQLRIEVNYDASCDEVYTEIAKALLSNGSRVLSFCRFPKDMENLPSWVPDWSASNEDELYWKWDGILDPSKAFKTSGSSVFEPRFPSNNRTLQIKGRYFDNVEKIVDESVQKSLISKYSEYQRRYDEERSAAKELSLRNFSTAAQTYLTVLKDFTAGREIYPSEALQDDAVWKTVIADMVLRSSDRQYTRSQSDAEEADKLRMAYKTVLNGNAYEDDATIENRLCNRHLYQHIQEEGVIPHLVPELGDYFDNALPWWENIITLFKDKPTLFQDMEKKVHEPDFQLDPGKKESMLAAMTYINNSERGLMETLLPILRSVLLERMEADEEASTWLKSDKFDPSVFLLLVGGRAIGRRAFCTSKGYLGLGPRHLQPGDHVVIVHGSTVPFILRSIEENKFTLIGEAYVHGIMDGEGMTEGKQPDVFVLC